MINGISSLLMVIYFILVMKICFSEGNSPKLQTAALLIVGIAVFLQIAVQNFKIQRAIRKIINLIKR
jgi:hypothetical protein